MGEDQIQEGETPLGSWEGFPDLWCGGHLMKESPSH